MNFLPFLEKKQDIFVFFYIAKNLFEVQKNQDKLMKANCQGYLQNIFQPTGSNILDLVTINTLKKNTDL